MHACSVRSRTSSINLSKFSPASAKVMAGVNPGVLFKIAELVGTSEPAIRLILSILIGYPLAFIHRYTLYAKPGLSQHLYFIITGLSIGYFNYGLDVLHIIVAVLITYAITKLLNYSALSVTIVFLGTLTHLLLGYYYTGTDNYDIKWTMPHCVLVLRLIGYAFDLYDGTLPDDKLSRENKQICIKQAPGFLEYCGFMFFPASFLVGPQFPLKRYQNFVSGVYRDSDNKDDLPQCIEPGLMRLSLGIMYLTIFQVGCIFFSESYMLSDDFNNLSFIRKCFYLALWAKFHLYKYISCWLITEGALITFGISHNGKDNNNVTQWNGCENVKLYLFENTTEFNHYIQSFNINTNRWVAQYVYKRLKFLGSRYLSQVFALLFLAVWHGFHSGYYVCFAFEFLVIYFEKDFKGIVNSNKKLCQFLERPGVKQACFVILRLYTFIFMGWCLVPFVMLKFGKYWHMFSTVHYMGFIVFVPWPIYKQLVKRIIVSDSDSSRSHDKTE